MKIALVGTVASVALCFRRDLIKAMVTRGDEVHVFAVDFDDKTRKAVYELGAIPVDYQLSRSGLNPINDLYRLVQLTIKLKKIKPDLVFSYFSKPVIFATLAAFFAGVKIRIAMLEGLGYLFTNQPSGVSLKIKVLKAIQIFLYRLSFPFLNHLIFLNNDDVTDLVIKYRLKVERVTVLGGIGLSLKDYPQSTAPSNPVVFLFIGRLLAEKGIKEFMTAAHSVKSIYPDSRFIVLGDADASNPGSLANEFLTESIKHGVIEHPGHVENVIPYIQKSSVFVLPSYREGLPRSTQEAMVVGRAIITTDVPGCRDTVNPGLNGFLIPPWQSEALIEKMIFFIENREKITQMGEASAQIARKNFDADVVNAKLLAIVSS